MARVERQLSFILVCIRRSKMDRMPVSILLLILCPAFLYSFSPSPRVLSRRRTTRHCRRTCLHTDAGILCSTPPKFSVETVSAMPEPLPESLKNQYYLLRHGQSTANVASIISSARSLAHSDQHGLTPLGYQQGKESAASLLRLLQDTPIQAGEELIFYSSPFARARQTAQACLDGLAELQTEIEKLGLGVQPDIVMEDRLMERFFGRLDGEAIYTYAYVWPLDKFNVTHDAFDVESVAAVATRLRQMVVEEKEAVHEGKRIVWVSHADVLQIAQLYGANAENVGEFSSFRFGNGEVRAMKRTPDSLPPPVPLEPPSRTI